MEDTISLIIADPTRLGSGVPVKRLQIDGTNGLNFLLLIMTYECSIPIRVLCSCDPLSLPVLVALMKDFLYNEDTDLSRRIHRKYKTIFHPGVSIVHEFQKDLIEVKTALIHLKSTVYYFNKWGWFFDNERKIINRKVLLDQSR
jgi:hypothetical protein